MLEEHIPSTNELGSETRRAAVILHRPISGERWPHIHDDAAHDCRSGEWVREEKFNRQVEYRSEGDPAEPASTQIDEWHSCTDPHLIMAHVTIVSRSGEIRQLASRTKRL